MQKVQASDHPSGDRKRDAPDHVWRRELEKQRRTQRLAWHTWRFVGVLAFELRIQVSLEKLLHLDKHFVQPCPQFSAEVDMIPPIL